MCSPLFPTFSGDIYTVKLENDICGTTHTKLLQEIYKIICLTAETFI